MRTDKKLWKRLNVLLMGMSLIACGPSESSDVITVEKTAVTLATGAPLQLDQARYYVERREGDPTINRVWIMLSNIKSNPCAVKCEDTAGESIDRIIKLNLRLPGPVQPGNYTSSAQQPAAATLVLTQPGCGDERAGTDRPAPAAHRTMDAETVAVTIDEVDLNSQISGMIAATFRSVDALSGETLSGRFVATHCTDLDMTTPSNPGS